MGFSDTWAYAEEHGGEIYYGYNLHCDFQDDRVVFRFPFGYSDHKDFEKKITKIFGGEVIEYDSKPGEWTVGVGIEYERVSDLLFDAFIEKTKKM